MATTTTFSTSTSNVSAYGTLRRPSSRQRTLRKSTSVGPGITTASTPNLNSLFNSQFRPPATPRSGLARKGSFATLTQSSLASIPDVSESYGFDTVLNDSAMPLITPGRPAPEDVAVGDIVDVPGGLQGTVRFVGSVQGKKGVFAGVELLSDYAARGKNSGDVDGVSYFTTSIPGAGIFLPAGKAVPRREISFPPSPSPGGLKVGTQNSTNYTPPMPSIPKFSQSVGPGRAPSPYGRKPRTSLPRPDSPVRRMQMTPGPRPSMGSPAKSSGPSRYGSPTTPRFAQSVRGTAGDPAKRMPSVRGEKSSIGLGPRSASAIGFDNDDVTPTALARPKANGSVGSVSSFSSKIRPASRANNDDEVERLRAQLGDRDRQLQDQTSTLAEMESTLTELQSLMDLPGGPRFGGPGPDDDKDSGQLRALVREKNEKIAMLTAEFDSHRADFRSTIDALEMASTETVRVYETQKREMMQEIQELTSRLEDVDSVATQLKQLEDLVQDLEEGLEDARRGEAEARGELEFLRGEVERTRAELRREKDKSTSAVLGKAANGNGGGSTQGLSKDVEQRDDEIRGLKAIIHSLSRGTVPADGGDPMEYRRMRDKFEREAADLRAVLEEKTRAEEDMARELDMLRRTNGNQRQSAMTVVSAKRSSHRDSRDTVVLSRSHESRSPEVPNGHGHGYGHGHGLGHGPGHGPGHGRGHSHSHGHKRGNTLDTMPESDAYSTATENSTLWCEICETGGHDILTCTNMFGPDGPKSTEPPKAGCDESADDDYKTLSPDMKIAPLSPIKQQMDLTPAQPTVRTTPNLLESGPLAGKDSGVVDETKWCALCERDGHDSVDCPLEDAF